MELNEFTVLAHTDYLVDVAEKRSKGEHKVLERDHLATLKAGGVDIICDHVGGETRHFLTFPVKQLLNFADPLQRALNGVDCMIQESEESPGSISIVRSIKDAKEAKANGNLGVILCLQGGMPLREDLSLLRSFYRLGIRCIHLTANRRNLISDSCMDRTDGGLSDFGVRVVEEMNRLGMVIDIAQLSPRGCLDVFETSTQPVIASNSNAKALCSHPRNLSDDVLQGLANNRGVMGLHCLPAFLKEEPGADIDDMIAHMHYVTDLVGVDHLALGPDLLEGGPDDRYECIWGKGQKLGDRQIEFEYPKGFTSIANIPDLADSMIDSGFTRKEVSMILGGNLLRVYHEVWGQ
jgi:membrane dipeptidase